MKVHHVGYLVKNIEKSQKEFIQLGYIPEKEARYDSEREVCIAFLENGSYRIELVEPKDRESKMYALLSRFKNSPYYICYETDEIEKTMKRMAEEGFVVIEELQPAICIGNRRVAFLMNRNIGMIELIESQTD